jgi:hypothetical protein
MERWPIFFLAVASQAFAPTCALIAAQSIVLVYPESALGPEANPIHPWETALNSALCPMNMTDGRACRVPSCWRTHCEPVEAMHPVGGRRGVEDVIVAEDFTFASSSVMGDDVTGLGFPACDAVDALTFSRLGHWRPAPVLRCRVEDSA